MHEYGGYRGSLPDIFSKDKFTGLFAPGNGVIAQAKWVQDNSLSNDYPALLKNSQLLLEIGRKNFIEIARKNPDVDGYTTGL